MPEITNQEKLKKLQHQLEKDASKLPLANSAKDIVPPEGNPNAELMFIGEAAGYHEHVQRRPFVGVAGKLLTKSLAEISIKREDVWISNMLKVRPPQNRDPLPEEVEAYKPYLNSEIEIIKPKIIITLGRFSMQKFIPDAYISKVRGQARWVIWEEKRLLIFPIYHPAAALRNGKFMQDFKTDMHKLKKLLETINSQNNSQEENSQDVQKEEENKEENEQLQLI